MPIGDERNVVTDTNGNVLDVIGVGPVMEQVPNVVQSTAQNIASWAAAPGEVFAGQQPQTPGMWSDMDEATAQANAAGQYQWGPETAMTMMGAGGAPAGAIAAGRPSIEYLNARRAAKPASGGKAYARTAKQAPEAETMTPEEQTAAKVESDWAMQNIAQEAYWDKLFEQFGLTRGYSLDETFGSGSRKLAPASIAASDPKSNFEAARSELKLTPQEEFLYQRHLYVLGKGGVPNEKEGGISTLYQTSAEHDGRFYNIPTLWGGKFLSEDEAAEQAGAVGWDNWPSYPTRKKAEQRYQKMHDYMEKDLQGLQGKQ